MSLEKSYVKDFNEVKEATKGVDVTIHVATRIAIAASLKNLKADSQVNTLRTLNGLRKRSYLQISGAFGYFLSVSS